MNMLCGLFSATDGEMRMNGQDIQSSIGRSYRRDNLGVCPQHDVLWDSLTVWEHLVFFAVIKGMARRDAERAADDMLAELALQEKRDVYAKSLSGGQKRRLSVAIAMIGGSSVVILDEPTSGVRSTAHATTCFLCSILVSTRDHVRPHYTDAFFSRLSFC